MTEHQPDINPMAADPADDYQPDARRQMYIEANRITAGLTRHDEEADETKKQVSSKRGMETIKPNKEYL